MTRIKYPRYKRSQKLNCKLNDRDIKEIKLLDENGIRGVEIARIFKVTAGCIYYNLLSKKARKEKNRRFYLLYGKERDQENIEEKHARQLRSLARKRQLMPERYRRYMQQYKKLYNKGR